MKNTSNVQVATGNNNILNNSGSVISNGQDSPELQELFQLIRDHGTPRLLKEFRERLMNIKQADR